MLPPCLRPVPRIWNTRSHLPNHACSRAHNMWKSRSASKSGRFMPCTGSVQHCQMACFRLRLLSRCPNPLLVVWNTRFHLPNHGFSRAHNMWKLRRASKLTLLMPRHGLGTVLRRPARAGLCRAAPGLNRGYPGSVTHRRRAFCEENPQRPLPCT